MRRAVAAALLAPLLLATPALAHGIVGKQDLPIPTWMFGWGAALALIVSFVALAFLWREPRLADREERAVAGGSVFRPLEVLGGLLGVALFAAAIYAGFSGVQNLQLNLAPSLIFIGFWVGVAVASILFGDVFAWLNPWRAIGRTVGWLARRAGQDVAPLPYPERLGRWPAAIGIGAFAWLELASQDRNDPSFLATMALVYAGIQLCGMAVYGERAWTRNVDGFAVLFRAFGMLSPLRWEDDRLHLRPPAVGALRYAAVPGATALLLVSIGTTSFDGFSVGPIWNDARIELEGFFGDLGVGGTWPMALAATVGLLAGPALVAGFYYLGIAGMRTVDRARGIRELGRAFAHSLVPIAAAYMFAHYFTLLVVNGQVLASLASDPLGEGSDLFGTRDWAPDLGWIAANTVWYIQVAALLAGHIAGLLLAHDRALELYGDSKAATRSQYWMLAVMVGFTSLALYLLSVGQS